VEDAELLIASVVDPELFAEFYRRQADGILRFFVNRTFDPETAADLTAETFAEALGSRHRFKDGRGSAAGWLYTIARRQLARFIARGKVEDRARRRLQIPRLSLDQEDYERIEELIDFEGIGRAITKAFSHLSKREREALTLRVIDGRTYEDAASAMRCSEQAARARVSRGLHRLERLIEV
jgi:RNA polymerase sigma-70 factor (ECF subfamily)